MAINSPGYLTDLLSQCHVDDSEKFLNCCGLFYQLLVRENEKYNLTRLSNEDDFWCRHVADSILIGKYFPEITSQSYNLLDVGSGAGFPAIILAAAYSNLTITALDSTNKKCEFIRMAGKKLGLSVKVVASRAREINCQDQWAQQFDIITARAVAEAGKIFSETRKMIKEEGKFIFYKTPSAICEISKTEKSSAKFGWQWRHTEEFDLPENAGKRIFIVGKNGCE